MLGVIYETVHTASGRRYRGQHRCTKKCGGLTGECRYLGSGVLILRAIAKYGRDAFERKILLVCEAAWLNHYEKEYVSKEWCERGDTFNLETGGDQPLSVSAEAWERRSKAQKERWSRPENCEWHSEMATKSWQDPEIRDRRVAGMLAANKDPEVRAKRSENSKRHWADPDARAKHIDALLAASPKKSAAVKRSWQDPEVKARRIEGLKRAWQNRKKGESK